MLFTRKLGRKRPTSSPAMPYRPVARQEVDPVEAELRRQLYERIAQCNALAEAEENAARIRYGRQTS